MEIDIDYEFDENEVTAVDATDLIDGLYESDV